VIKKSFKISEGKKKKETTPKTLSIFSKLTLASVSVAWNTSVSHAVIVGTNTSSWAT